MLSLIIYFSRKLNVANDEMFKREVEKMGLECIIMKYGDEIFVQKFYKGE